MNDLAYAHDAQCNVVHKAGPELCPPPCEHEWRVTEFHHYRYCPKCESLVAMRAYGLTLSGWIGDYEERRRA